MALLGHSRTAEQQQELREAKRLLRDRVRNDWHYPPLPAYQRYARKTRLNDTSSEGVADGEQKDASFRFTPVDLSSGPPVDSEVPDVTGWQERVNSTESGSDAEAAASTAAVTKGRSGLKGKQSTEFRFEGPDSVGSQIRERKVARKRKRIMAAQEELSWNEGLSHWTAQRDAWSGARSAAAEEPSSRSGERRAQNDARRVSLTTGGFAISAESTPRTSTSSITSPVATSSAATTPDPTTQHVPHTLPGTTPPHQSQHTPPNEPLIPTCASILPHHPIRRRITPSMYTEIYTKIIVQGRTPSVPINLLTLVSALVEGWKADGEWPPKPGVVEPTIGRRKGKGSGSGGSGVREGVKAVVRTLKLVGSSEVGSRKDG
ncbi:hypothetical protein LTR78_005030 [Recurvomyces mirabilis]|uniref:Gag1-like clamp domain-containing protein n=1 Tax=Recurvomyces mirabilis TaxID=574656 RepID=A0AAE0WNK9_9PEZI|nr:hypothetical protein LTR78_005030 [Recurvomyces mirabilis]KAK5158354.1 hypothetical protein LTS14_003372 [Recurvomyces mirabilis]